MARAVRTLSRAQASTRPAKAKVAAKPKARTPRTAGSDNLAAPMVASDARDQRVASLSSSPRRSAAPSPPRPASAASPTPPASPASAAGPEAPATGSEARRIHSGAPKGGSGGGDAAPPSSTDEEQAIESSKYLSRHTPPKRLFEEERFLFPESYGSNRVRLLVKDPEWLFAHWDVDRKILASLSQDLGERTIALARLTLKIADPTNGGTTVILLPPGARGWYVHADSAPRTYRAELGLTLPSGEFRHLADSNTVTTPRVGPAGEGSRRRMHFRADRGALAGSGPASSSKDLPGPWPSARMDGHEAAPTSARSPGRSKGRKGSRKGGASDVYRR